jgi:hypothetical protein
MVAVMLESSLPKARDAKSIEAIDFGAGSKPPWELEMIPRASPWTISSSSLRHLISDRSSVYGVGYSDHHTLALAHQRKRPS